VLAGTVVRTEQISHREWAFKEIIRPSKSDAALHATIAVASNRPASSCLSPDGLHNGVLPQQAKQIRDFFCFSNENPGVGRLAMDLGRVISLEGVLW
jgi:hypothetical protein